MIQHYKWREQEYGKSSSPAPVSAALLSEGCLEKRKTLKVRGAQRAVRGDYRRDLLEHFYVEAPASEVCSATSLTVPDVVKMKYLLLEELCN